MKQYAQLMIVAQLKSDQAQAVYADLLRREHDLKAQLSKIRQDKAKSHHNAAPQNAIDWQVDARWVRWVDQEIAQLTQRHLALKIEIEDAKAVAAREFGKTVALQQVIKSR